MRQAPLAGVGLAVLTADVSAVQRGGGCEIRTREGLPPTRFPSVRPRPLGESSAGKLTGPAETPGSGADLSAHVDRLAADPPHGVILANSPRAGRQQGYAGSVGCAGGPFPSRPRPGEDADH